MASFFTSSSAAHDGYTYSPILLQLSSTLNEELCKTQDKIFINRIWIDRIDQHSDMFDFVILYSQSSEQNLTFCYPGKIEHLSSDDSLKHFVCSTIVNDINTSVRFFVPLAFDVMSKSRIQLRISYDADAVDIYVRKKQQRVKKYKSKHFNFDKNELIDGVSDMTSTVLSELYKFCFGQTRRSAPLARKAVYFNNERRRAYPVACKRLA